MSPTFILGPTPSSSSTPLPISPALNLLPFSLGPTSKPLTSSTAPLSTYFRPRPAPAGIPGVEAGTPIAAFRGRQIAGQSVPVPRGYMGFIISADRPDVVKYASTSTAVEEDAKAEVGPRRGRTRRDQWPLTPATSTASVQGDGSTAPDGINDGTELRRSPKQGGFAKLKQRVRGAGQTALARPKRGVVKTGMKRYRLDSDDEDEAGNVVPEATEETPAPMATPAKRPRPSALLPNTPTRQSPRLSQPRTPAPSSSRKLPAIVLQEATPLKEPLPPPPPHLRRRRSQADYVIPGSPGAVREGDAAVGEDTIREELEEGGIIPSPATEDDPHLFPISSPAPSPHVVEVKDEPAAASRSAEQEISGMMDISGVVRVLRPISTFNAISLWTPDGPLAGYKSLEKGQAGMETMVDVKGKGKAKEEDPDGVEDGVKEENGPKVREGWWAPGGSGEGGDEVVRAMGEWLGLVEMLNKPVYLDTLKHEDGFDEDEEEEDA